MPVRHPSDRLYAALVPGTLARLDARDLAALLCTDTRLRDAVRLSSEWSRVLGQRLQLPGMPVRPPPAWDSRYSRHLVVYGGLRSMEAVAEGRRDRPAHGSMGAAHDAADAYCQLHYPLAGQAAVETAAMLGLAREAHRDRIKLVMREYARGMRVAGWYMLGTPIGAFVCRDVFATAPGVLRGAKRGGRPLEYVAAVCLFGGWLFSGGYHALGPVWAVATATWSAGTEIDRIDRQLQHTRETYTFQAVLHILNRDAQQNG